MRLFGLYRTFGGSSGMPGDYPQPGLDAAVAHAASCAAIAAGSLGPQPFSASGRVGFLQARAPQENQP